MKKNRIRNCTGVNDIGRSLYIKHTSSGIDGQFLSLRILSPHRCRRRYVTVDFSIANGALLYRVNPVLCVLRREQPGQLKSGLFCVTAFRTRECLPCAAYAAIPAHFAAGTICFQQTVPAAKSEMHNPEPEHHLHGVLAPSCRRVSPMFIGRKHQQEAICIGTNAPAVDISLPG